MDVWNIELWIDHLQFGQISPFWSMRSYKRFKAKMSTFSLHMINRVGAQSICGKACKFVPHLCRKIETNKLALQHSLLANSLPFAWPTSRDQQTPLLADAISGTNSNPNDDDILTGSLKSGKNIEEQIGRIIRLSYVYIYHA